MPKSVLALGLDPKFADFSQMPGLTPEHLLLFEKLLNLVHAQAPGAKICFNTKPTDTPEAVQRWG